MKQVAKHVTMDDWGFLNGRRYLILDRDSKFCAAFRHIIASAGVKIIRLPPRSPNLNAFAERFVRSVKDEALSKLVLFGEEGLRRALDEFMSHYHEERNHQGVGNVLLFPSGEPAQQGPVECEERLGGLLEFYSRAAA
jgi:transposase InsO family protein